LKTKFEVRFTPSFLKRIRALDRKSQVRILREVNILKKITLHDDSYWKLQELKAKLHCTTWQELVNKLYDICAEKRR